MTSKQCNSAFVWLKIAIFLPCLVIFFPFASTGDVGTKLFNTNGMNFEVVSEEPIDVGTVVSPNMQDSSIKPGNGRGESGNKFGGSDSKRISFISERHESMGSDDPKEENNSSNGPKDICAEDIVHWIPLILLALFNIYVAGGGLDKSKT